MNERTRTCHICQRPYSLEGIYFHLLPGPGNGFDTVCISCRRAHGERDIDLARLRPEGMPDELSQIRAKSPNAKTLLGADAAPGSWHDG